MKSLNEEIAKEAPQMKLKDFERSDFWKEIRATKMVTLGCDVEFQTVAFTAIPKISNEAIEVVSDKVAKLEYSDEKIDKAVNLTTFGDFQNLMKASGSWRDLRGNVKWLGLGIDMTIKFPKDISKYDVNEKASDILVDIWLRNEENNIKEGRQPTSRNYNLQPIPIDRLFVNTFTANMTWHRVKGESIKRAKSNIEAWNEGKTKPREDSSYVTIKSFVDAFEGEVQPNGSFLVSIPKSDAKFHITIPKIDPRSSLSEIDTVYVKEVETNLTNTYTGEYIQNQFYKNNKAKDVMDVVAIFIKIFDSESGSDEEPTELITRDKLSSVTADKFFNRYLRIKNNNGEGTLKVGGGKLGNGLFWTYTTKSSNITYKINIDYKQGDLLLKNELAFTIEHEGKTYSIPNNSLFFNETVVVVKTSPSKKSFSFGFKQVGSETNWWKSLVQKAGEESKQNIKIEDFHKKLDSIGLIEKKSNVDYWDKQNFKQDSNKEYWAKYWKEMGF